MQVLRTKQYLMSEEEFRSVVKEYYQKVFRLCFRYFGNSEDAKDAVQEVMVKLWTNWNKFRGESARSTWIFRIATNVCITSIKKNTLNTVQIDDWSFTDPFDCIEETLETKHEQEEKILFFNRFQEKLNLADKVLINLYLENIDSKEIAAVVGLSDMNVRTRICRIKSQIKKEWEEHHGIE